MKKFRDMEVVICVKSQSQQVAESDFGLRSLAFYAWILYNTPVDNDIR